MHFNTSEKGSSWRVLTRAGARLCTASCWLWMAEQVYSGSWIQNGVWQLCQGVWAAQWQGRNRDDSIPFISKSPAYVRETSTVIKKKEREGEKENQPGIASGMTSDFFETLVKMEHRNKAKKKEKGAKNGRNGRPKSERARRRTNMSGNVSTHLKKTPILIIRTAIPIFFFLFPFLFLLLLKILLH